MFILAGAEFFLQKENKVVDKSAYFDTETASNLLKALKKSRAPKYLFMIPVKT
jgi:hypothetical protein